MKIPVWVLAGLFCLPMASLAQTAPKPEEQSRRGFYKMMAGTLGASIGLVLVKAGNNEDPFTGDKSKSQMMAGLALTGGGAFLMWNGWRDIQSARKMPSIGIAVTPRSATVVYRRTW